MTITFQSSVIFVQDIAASRRFYEELLGQEIEMDVGPSVEFKGGFSLWQIDHAFQIIYQHVPDIAERQGRQNHELHFETADARTASVVLSEAGVEFVHPVREMPWGKRIFRVRDPDGHIVAVGEPMTAVIARLLGEGLSAEAVAERTAMQIEIVEQIAQGAMQ
jgi:catechol 2,3-dioxygenase-like lactoylglutathione lyase family enzyme